MHFVRYDTDRLGLLTSDQKRVIDLTEPLELSSDDPLIEYLKGDYNASSYADALGDHDVNEIALNAPLRWPRKIVAAPSNYRDHIIEMSGTRVNPISYFLKAPSSIIGPSQTIELPFVDRRIDHEVELACVMGEDVKNIDRDEAREKIFGYTILLDISMRGDEDRSNRKSYDTFTVIGPGVVTGEELGDPEDLDIRLLVNGEERQASNTSQMIYSFEEIIEFASHSATINAGDVITTGTPSGVGELSGGDTVRAGIEKIGTMTLDVVQRDVRYEDVVIHKQF